MIRFNRISSYMRGAHMLPHRSFTASTVLFKQSTTGGRKKPFKNNPKVKQTVLSTSKPVTTEWPKSKVLPTEYPQLLGLAVSKRPMFPGFYQSIAPKNPKVREAIKNLYDRDEPYIGLFMKKNYSDDNIDVDFITDINQVHSVGVFAQITNIKGSEHGDILTFIIYPHRRIKATEFIAPTLEAIETAVKKDTSLVNVSEKNKPSVLAVNLPIVSQQIGLVNVENIKNESIQDRNYVSALISEILNLLKALSQSSSLVQLGLYNFSHYSTSDAYKDPALFADFVMCLCKGEPDELQRAFESTNVEIRLRRAMVILKKELANSRLGNHISKEIDEKIGKKNQEYYLMEKLNVIKKELGMDKGGKESTIEKFKKRAETLKMPEHVKTVFDEEIMKLSNLEPTASEFNVTRNYLDWLTLIPWGVKSTENFDVDHAAKVLDEDHYGLKDVKDRILEFIAVGKLRNSVEGKIICLVGPPGVGKTSIGKSIARSLGREFYRFSVGGLTDVAEIKGHRRTYVGALPGKIIQSLKRVQTENPLIMIDEIDKISKGNQGDPASALLELLDPEQNNSFVDHYLDIPLDVSKVLFVCTANVTESIPGPLLDRMEIINLSGYIAEEKLAIAKTYLAPVAQKESGLEGRGVSLTEAAIFDLIKYWCRESGVRNLKKQIEKIYRKAALKLVRMSPASNALAVIDPKAELGASDEFRIIIDSGNLKEYVGSPLFSSERMYENTPPGVVMGLAWTSLGGSILYMESILESFSKEAGKARFNRTGQLGDVMKESTTIAYSFSKSLIARKFPSNKFFDSASIHMHIPEGATPKDGPSAGCTMATSLLSLALDRPVSSDIAMTGELTLTGLILKIGGLKEKTIAAKRSGVTRIIFPVANRPDWEELQGYIKEGIDAIFVQNYDEIFDVVFPKAADDLLSTSRISGSSSNIAEL